MYFFSVMSKIKTQFTDVSNPTAYTGAARIAQKLHKPFREVRAILEEDDSYALHKPVRKKFKRLVTKGHAKFDTLQADLADFQKISQHNDGYNYLLVCVDVYSRMIFARPLKQKTGPEMVKALTSIFKENDFFPTIFITDRGKEFYNRHLSEFFKGLHVQHASPSSEIKAGMAERAIRTLKERVYRYFTHKNTYRWLEIIPQLVKNYNITPHSRTKIAPVEVSSGDIEEREGELSDIGDDLVEGTVVRLSKARHVFKKAYEESWTRELFVVAKVYKTKPVTYRIKTLDGRDIIEGKVYRKELQIAHDTKVYRISDILQRKRVRGKEKILVTWLDYPDAAPEWVDAADFVSI